MSRQIAEFFTPENLLQKKTGIGGLPEAIIKKAQDMGDSVQFDFKPYAVTKITFMKEQLNSDTFITAQNDNSIDDFLFHLVPFDVNAKLSKNRPLSMISDHLLKFVEALNLFNIDSHHVIKAHVNAMDIVTTKELYNENDPILETLMKELKAVCDRYHAKHGKNTLRY